MSGTQRGALALFLVGLLCIAIKATPHWYAIAITLIGYAGFVSDNIGRHVLRALFTVVWCAGWLFRLGRQPRRLHE